MASLSGLSHINIELTSRCCKECFMCGRRKIEKDYPHLADWGDMPLDMVVKIADQVPAGVFVQLHNNGEPLLYPALKAALQLFTHCHTGLDTNGKLLAKKAYDLIGNIDTLTVSVIPKDPERQEQIVQIERFLALKGEKKPLVVFRFLGNAQETVINYMAVKHNCLMVHRVLHSPMGSFNYEKEPVKPEFGICTEMLHKLSIDRFGRISPCVRFDPEGLNILGKIGDDSLYKIWTGYKRNRWLSYHKKGLRKKVPLCKTCEYYGIPRG
jgi:MoaA/NifB/PqqE/SkfB family radical SAM enzyme